MSDPHTDARTAILQLLGSGPVAYYPALAAIAGGVTAGVFLAQLFYWHDKGSDPAGWIYKTQAEWQAETGLTRWEQETARRYLRERGIVEEKRGGIPARLYYRLDVARVIELLADRSIAGDGVAGKDAAAPQSSMRKPHDQRCGNTTNKDVATPQTSVRQPCKHAETTREHSREKGSEKTSENTSAAGSQQVLCSIHGKPMKLRHKDGDSWYSHRLPDGSWCKGAPRDDPSGRADPLSWEYRREYATQFGWDLSRFSSPDPEPTLSSGSEGSVTPTRPDDHPRQVTPREVRGRVAAPGAFRDAGHARGPPAWKSRGWVGKHRPEEPVLGGWPEELVLGWSSRRRRLSSTACSRRCWSIAMCDCPAANGDPPGGPRLTPAPDACIMWSR